MEKGEGKSVSGSPDCDDGRVVCERGQGQSSERLAADCSKANAQVCSIVTKSEVMASSVCSREAAGQRGEREGSERERGETYAEVVCEQ